MSNLRLISGSPRPGIVLFCLGLMATLMGATAVYAGDRLIASGTIPADWPENTSSPIAIPCSPIGPLPPKTQVMIKTPNRVSWAEAQFEAADKVAGTPDRIWIYPGSLKAGDPVRLYLSPGEKPLHNPYRTRRDGEQLHITTADGKPVLSYWYGRPAPGQRYPLTDFIHPLVGLDGEIMTDKSPSDHLHHRGVYWTWVRYERNGQSLGSWWIPNNTHVENRDLAFEDGPVFSRFQARHQWVYQPKDARKSLTFADQQVVCRVFPGYSEGRAIDFDITVTALVDGVRIGGTTDLDKGYGGFNIRYAPAEDVKVVADGQNIPENRNRLRTHWADWTGRFKLADGKFAEKPSGTAIFTPLDHPDAPPEWITRLYGFLNVSYPGLQMLDLPKGKPLRLHYRIWVHRGDTEQGRVEEAYRAYVADWKWKAVADGEAER